MVTAILIALLLVVLLATGSMVYMMIEGCFFATMWMMLGGLGNAMEAAGVLIGGIFESISE